MCLLFTDALCTCAPRPRLWWVTDASRLRKKDEQKANEDGPTSSEDGEAQDEGQRKPDDALTSDSDPDSPRSDRGASQSQQAVVLPVRYDTRAPCDPSVQWTKTYVIAVLTICYRILSLYHCHHLLSCTRAFEFHSCDTFLSARALFMVWSYL